MANKANVQLVPSLDHMPSNKCDLLVALGYGFVENWQLSDHVKKRLGEVSKLYHQGVANKIAVCGRWAMKWDKEGIVPPTTEAEEMRKFLVGLGVPNEVIIVEDNSKDSIGNAYFLRLILETTDIRSLVVLCADYVQERVLYCWEKVYSDNYTVDIIATESPYHDDANVKSAQFEVLKTEQEFLQAMRKGDLTFLQDLYSKPHYARARPQVADAVGKGGDK